MNSRWMTLSEIALDRHLSLEAARRLVEASNCPKVFRAEGTVYLL